MASSTINAIKVEKTPIQRRRLSEARQAPPSAGISLVQYHADFGSVVGNDPDYALLLSSAESSHNPFFHGGCAHVFEAATAALTAPSVAASPDEVLYVTSNMLQTTSSSQLPVILISRVAIRRSDDGDITAVEWTKLRPPSTMPMPAGAIPYSASQADGILYCAQGSPNPGTSGLFFMPRGRPPQALVTSYYGHDFNSVHDVACAPDGSLWFTDPCHGFEREFRKTPQLPCHVYRFDPASGELRVVADSLQRPTGICISPDASTVYVTDTDSLHADGKQNPTRAATIYAFDVIRRGSSDFLANRRVFAYALHGVPIGVRCDPAGNVYAGCADGVEVWNAGGSLLGVIEVPGGVSSFCISTEGEMFLCSEQQLWWLHVKKRPERSRGEALDLMT
ncbi:smp-30/gluconolaconase/lre-like region containing protein [Grosmannia clavigera kw1407]|uniref:Smp-30/gluconolaconase/lre-like region containing protein n=1 Tax=Grosmannia clavigera (strain kw1407 / UAMH 11150) TaxID=655863 RepID=F0X8G1_GROCL|nr:smp-30/gluconolaconase/lre-like region containing protein [Grosmannia clavigera kw1407]EFX05390.1 smp-30/gluconolaconase/lre-like region containing protein [Grosmannia clavigera kw1407]